MMGDRREETRIGGFARTPFIAISAVNGLMAIAAVAASLYAFVGTPNLHEVPIVIDGRSHRMESKVAYLFWPPLFQAAIFFVSLQFVRAWKFHADLSENPPEFFRRFIEPTELTEQTRINSQFFVLVALSVQLIFCAVGALLLLSILNKCAWVLSLP